MKKPLTLLAIFTVSSTFCVFVVVSTRTLWLHPRPRPNILARTYTAYPDLVFQTAGNKNLVVALHGMYANPWVFEELGQRLSNQGWDLFAPALPNATISSDDLRRQEVYQWKESLQVAKAKVVSSTNGYDRVVILGHSQGGALALVIASQVPELDGVAVVSAPLFLEYKNDWFRNFLIQSAGFFYFFTPNHGVALGKEPPEELAQLEDTRGGGTYVYGLTAHSMRLGLKNEVIPSLPKITMPLFAAYEVRDHTVSFDNLELLTNRINSITKDVLVTDSSEDKAGISTQHKLFSYIYTKEILHQRIEKFLSTWHKSP
ncbi:MAG: alpha/beta hydrolase [Brevinema sp.]